MKTNLLFTLVLCSLFSSVSSQEKINQVDSAGKKFGRWIVYLDKNWERTEDTAKALYFRYTHYEDGTNIYPMGPCGLKGYRLEEVSQEIKTKRPKLLDGEYKWYDAKGRLSSVHILKKGEYVSCTEYYKTGEIEQHFDYTKKCYDHEHGWVVYNYNKKGEKQFESWMCKQNGKWPPTKG
jgi:hypothetical protein